MTTIGITPGGPVLPTHAEHRECGARANVEVAHTERFQQHHSSQLRRVFDSQHMVADNDSDLSGVLVGRGLINGMSSVAYCTDPSVMGGAMGSAGCRRIADAIRGATERGEPLVGIWHSGGARIQEGVGALHGVGEVFAAMVHASGRVPQISVVLGPAAGGAAYGPALTDIVIMSQQGRLFVTGPEVIRSVTGEDVDMETLGGAEVHGSRSGVVHIVTGNDTEAFTAARDAVGLLADQRSVDQELAGISPGLGELLPDNSSRAYNIRPLIQGIIDQGTWLELHPKWAPNVVTGIARLAGRTVGIVANNPLRLGGCLDSTSAEKAARFVRMCDSFGVPLVVLVDVPGYLPGVRQEWEGILRRGAKLLHAFAEAVVPRVTLIIRKAYGGAYVAMNSRALGATSVLAWPESEVAVMGAEAAVKILHRKRLATLPPEKREELSRVLVAEHKRVIGGVCGAQDLGVVDAVIDPVLTRAEIAAALLKALPLRGSHGNIPL